MATIDLGTFIQRHEELTADARRRLKAVGAGRLESVLKPEQLIAAKEAEVLHARGRLEEDTKSRDAAVARYELVLERRKAEVEQLEKELVELRRKLEGGVVDRRLAKVSEVASIGATFEQRLIRAGVTSVGQLVAVKADKLAELLDVTVSQAESLLANARSFLEG
jgi:hypothetical protein